MSVLLDSHALVWWLTGGKLLTKAAEQLIDNEDAFVSSASAYEIALKAGRGKWPEALPLVQSFAAVCERNKLVLLPISLEHALAAAAIASQHRDPFDRLLAAQARIENMSLISIDPVMKTLGCQVVW